MQKIVTGSDCGMLCNVYTSPCVSALFDCLKDRRRVFAVVDQTASDASVEIASLIGRLERDGVCVTRLQTSETLKSVGTAVSLCGWLLENGADRNSFLLAVGGGVLTDIAGFAASIYMRGISFGFVPTTLLAQVDASVGGKTGVNFMGLKNMLGIFRQPEFTFICPRFLVSLPVRVLFSGVAELLKSFVISNHADNYSRTVSLFSRLREKGGILDAGAEEELEYLVAEAVRVKATVVAEDQFERGERRKLNLGHTFAHAVEYCAMECGDDITHGEAVAFGMVMAARLSVRAGMARQEVCDRITADIKACGFDIECRYDDHMLEQAIVHDKKSEGNLINFVWIEDIGRVKVAKLPVSDLCTDRKI